MREIIVNDSILSAQCKTQLIEYALDNNEHTGLGVTFAEALQYVFTRIDLNKESGDNIKAILNQEMTDALCMCFTGRISRLLNCLTAIDPLVRIHIVDLSDMFINVGKRLSACLAWVADACACEVACGAGSRVEFFFKDVSLLRPLLRPACAAAAGQAGDARDDDDMRPACWLL